MRMTGSMSAGPVDGRFSGSETTGAVVTGVSGSSDGRISVEMLEFSSFSTGVVFSRVGSFSSGSLVSFKEMVVLLVVFARFLFLVLFTAVTMTAMRSAKTITAMTTVTMTTLLRFLPPVC